MPPARRTTLCRGSWRHRVTCILVLPCIIVLPCKIILTCGSRLCHARMIPQLTSKPEPASCIASCMKQHAHDSICKTLMQYKRNLFARWNLSLLYNGNIVVFMHAQQFRPLPPHMWVGSGRQDQKSSFPTVVAWMLAPGAHSVKTKGWLHQEGRITIVIWECLYIIQDLCSLQHKLSFTHQAHRPSLSSPVIRAAVAA